MDLTFIKLLLGTISPFILLLIIDHYNMKNKRIINIEELEEALKSIALIVLPDVDTLDFSYI